MKAKLEFDLDRVEDEEKFRVCSNGVSWFLVCLGIDKEMRDLVKYHNAHEDVSLVRQKLYNLMDQHGVSLEDMS